MRFPLVSLLVMTAAVFGTNGLVAGETEPVAKETNPAEKPPPTITVPAKPRLVSAEIAERVVRFVAST